MSGKDFKLPPEPAAGILAGELKKLEQTLGVPESLASRLAEFESFTRAAQAAHAQTLPLARAMEAARAQTLPFERAAEAMCAQTLHFEEAAKQTNRTLELMNAGFARAGSAVSIANSEFARSMDSIAKTIDLTKRFQEARALDLQKQFQEVAPGILEFQRHIEGASPTAKMFANLTRTLGLDQPRFLEATSSVKKMMEAVAAPALDIRKMMAELQASSAITLLSAGSFASSTTLNLTSVPEVVLEVVERNLREAGAQMASQTAEVAPSVEKVPGNWPWDRRLKKEPEYVQYIVYILLFFLLQPLIEGYFHALWERWMNSGSHEARTQIAIEIQQNFGPDRLTPLRCVKRAIDVREGPSTTSRVTGRLSADQPVEVLEKHGPFSRIRYRDVTDGEIREGWAASGFLLKSKC